VTIELPAHDPAGTILGIGLKPVAVERRVNLLVLDLDALAHEEQVRIVLTLYLHDKATLPTAAKTRADGHAALAAAIKRTGGFRRWRAKLDLPQPPPSTGTRRRRWTHEAIASELAAFCRNRDTFPTERQFQAAGRRGLHRAHGRS
jgi:hypothetical protein